ARFLTPALIAVIIFMACGTKLLYNSNRIVGAAVAVMLVVWMFAIIHPIIDQRHDYSGQKEFALWIASVTEEDSILVTTDQGFFYSFYTGRPVIHDPDPSKDKGGWIGHYQAGSQQDVQEFIRLIHGFLQNGTPVYMAESGIGYDPQGIFRKALQENFDIYPVDSKMNEAYSQNTLQFQKYEEKLFRLAEKGSANQNQGIMNNT
ncbi:MAG: hypothetical protein R6U32_00620, partial [Candidatus Woesearchaeota archaeon]